MFRGSLVIPNLSPIFKTTTAPENHMAQFNLLQQTLLDCQNLNSTNAKIIAMSQKTVERNLNIIKGVDEKAMVYTSDGATEMTPSRLNGVKA